MDIDYINIRDNVKVFCDNKHIAFIDVNNIIYNIKVYTIRGSYLFDIVDTKIDDSLFTRNMDNVTHTIDNNGNIVNTTINIKLYYIKPNKTSFKHRNLTINTPKIGTLDLEIYDNNDKPKVYAIGYFIKQSKVKTFYIDSTNLDSYILNLYCINSMLVPINNGYTFYVHNFGNYDIGFIVKVLTTANTIYNI